MLKSSVLFAFFVSLGSTGSFEDKRKENYDKGQAELDRRRKVILDMEAREREERQRKEREEFERKEKARYYFFFV